MSNVVVIVVIILVKYPIIENCNAVNDDISGKDISDHISGKLGITPKSKSGNLILLNNAKGLGDIKSCKSNPGDPVNPGHSGHEIGIMPETGNNVPNIFSLSIMWLATASIWPNTIELAPWREDIEGKLIEGKCKLKSLGKLGRSGICGTANVGGKGNPNSSHVEADKEKGLVNDLTISLKSGMISWLRVMSGNVSKYFCVIHYLYNAWYDVLQNNL